MTELIGILIPIVVAGATTFVFDKLKDGLTILDRAPAFVKQVIVAIVAFGLTKASVFLGVSLSTTDIAALSSADLSALLSASLAYVFHTGKQAKMAREGR